MAIGLVGAALLLGAIISTIGFAAASRNARLAAAATEKAEEQAARATSEAERANAETSRARTAQEQAEVESYFANLAAADVALNANEPGGVQERLNACPERLRNWEWRYLDRGSMRAWSSSVRTRAR